MIRNLWILPLALALSLAGLVASPASAAEKNPFSITTRYVKASDEVVGTAKNVGGRWVLALEWRASKASSWQKLAQSNKRTGKKRARVANKVHSSGFDFSGQWRTCVVKDVRRGKKKTCGKPITVPRAVPQTPDEPVEEVPEVPVDEVPDDIDNPPVDAARVEREVFELTNAARAEAGLSMLAEDECLDRFADAQAQAQADAQTMFHQEILYVVVECDMPLVGENVAYGYQEAAAVQEGWMNSPGHRANILARDWTHVGVGVAIDANGRPAYAVVFGAPPVPWDPFNP